MAGTEVITMDDKDQRDRLFDDLRKNGNEQERQVVKFSSTRKLEDGGAMGTHISTWSVAYPRS